MNHSDLVLVTAVSILLLPVVTIASYKTGKATAWQQMETELEAREIKAYQAARISERLKAQHEIDRLEATHQERGDAFLKGAERGLNVVDKIVTAKAAAQAARQAVVLPVQGQIAYPGAVALSSGDDDVIDL